MIRLPLTPDEAAAVAYAIKLALALQRASGNVGAAARALDMDRRTLDRHIVTLSMAELRAAYSMSERQPKRGALKPADIRFRRI